VVVAAEDLMRRLVALVLVASLQGVPGVGRAGTPPVPPPDHPPVALAAGASYTAPEGGAVCLDEPAARYQLDRRAYDEARVAAALELAEARPLKVVAWSASVGLVVGAIVGGVLAARALK